MSKKIVLKKEIIKSLKKINLQEGMNVIVHTSLSSFGYVCGGAQTIIEALISVVGINGTIMMPTQSWKNLDPSSGVHWEISEEDWPLIRENWPAYDKDLTPTNTMGIVAEFFRKYPGVMRSDHPSRSVAAWGKNANFFTENHDLNNIFGENSPLSRLYDLDGYVLLLGTDYDKNTVMHLADSRANYPGKKNEINSSAMIVDGKRKWVDYETLFVDGEDFIEIGKDFEKNFIVDSIICGKAQLKLIKVRDLVDFSVNWIEKNRK